MGWRTAYVIITYFIPFYYKLNLIIDSVDLILLFVYFRSEAELSYKTRRMYTMLIMLSGLGGDVAGVQSVAIYD